MATKTELLHNMDNIGKQLLELRKLSSELYEDGITDYDILEEFESLNSMLDAYKDNLRDIVLQEDLDSSETFNMAYISVNIQPQSRLDVDAIISDNPKILTTLGTYFEPKYKLVKGTNKLAFKRELEAQQIDPEKYTHKTVKIIKKLKGGK